MKAIILFFACLLTMAANSQKIVENKVDEFTKHAVKRTDYEKAFQTFKGNMMHVALKKIDSTKFLSMKLMLGGVFSIREGQELMFKMKDGSIVSFQNLKYAITCAGCGAVSFIGSTGEGIESDYLTDDDKLNKLTAQLITKIRVYTSSGYIEEDVKEKNAIVLQKMLKLIP